MSWDFKVLPVPCQDAPIISAYRGAYRDPRSGQQAEEEPPHSHGAEWKNSSRNLSSTETTPRYLFLIDVRQLLSWALSQGTKLVFRGLFPLGDPLALGHHHSLLIQHGLAPRTVPHHPAAHSKGPSEEFLFPQVDELCAPGA